MPAKYEWSAEEIETAKRLRSERKTWGQISKETGIGMRTVIDCAKREGFWTPNLTHWVPAPKSETPRVPSMVERPPLPAGSVETWGLLTAKTCLEGSPYTPPALYR